MTVTLGNGNSARALSRLRVGAVIEWPAATSLLQMARPTKPLAPRMRRFMMSLAFKSV